MNLVRPLSLVLAMGFAVTVAVAVPVPRTPTNLSAAAISSSQINLAWSDQSTNEDGFRLERATSSSGPWTTVATVGANATSYSNTGLAGSTLFYFRVFATNTGGTSGSSNIAAASTPAAPPSSPAAPSGLAAATASYSQINLTWVDNASNETGFKIDRATASGGPWTQVATPGANSTYYPIYNLNPSTTYYFRVRAGNANGDSANSAVANATTPAAPPPPPNAAPTNVTATAVSASQINLSWTDTCTNETSYVIERTTGSTWAQIASLPANYTSYSNTGLASGTTYSYRLSTSNAAGSRYAAVVSATTQSGAPTAPAAPSGLNASAVSSSQINLTWADNSTNETGFNLERATSSAGPFSTIATTGSNAIAYSNTGLTGGTTYYYRARSFNTSGSSAYTPVVSATTSTSVTIPAAPSGLQASAASSSQINLVWTDNSSNEQGFSVERATSSSGPWSVIATTALSSTSNSGLTASSTYYYRVRSYNTAGNSAYSNTASATTTTGSSDTTDPTVPSNVTTTSPACGKIKITWSGSTDLGGSGLKGYNVYRKGVYASQTLAPTIEYTDTGLNSAGYYYYTISAIDNASSPNESVQTTAVGTYALSCAGSGGDFQWANHTGGDIYPDEGLAAAKDASGNTFVTGDFSGTANFGLGNMTSAGTRDIFVAKYRDDGSLLWAKRFGGAYDDFGESIAVDGSGNVLVTGKFQGSIDLGSGLASAGGYDIFLAKLSTSNGSVMWSKRIGGTGGDEGASLALDSSGNIFVTGQFQGAVDFGGGSAANTNPYAQIFVAKYSGVNGAHIWSKRFAKLTSYTPFTIGSGRGVSVDPSGNAVITGYFSGPVDFGGGALTHAGAMDVFVAKLAGADGHWIWSKGFGDASDQHANAVSTDSSGNVVITGDFLGSINFGTGALPSSTNTQTIFLAKFNAADGSTQWAKSFVAAGMNVGSYGWAVTVDGANNVVMAGQMSGPVDLGGGPLTNAGGVFVAKYSSTGVPIWSKNFRGGGGQGRGIDVSSTDRIVMTGSFDTIQDFGGGDLRSNGNSGSDLFVLYMLP